MSDAATVAQRYWRPLALFVLGVVLAASALVWRDHASRPRYVVTVNQIQADPYDVLASDCPVNQQCRASAVRAETSRLVLGAFGGVVVGDLAHDALADDAATRRETVDVRTSAGVAVRLVSLCVDHGSPARADQSTSVPAAGPATVFVVVPGRAGCSVAVVVQVPRGVRVPWTAATTLAHRAELQLQ